MIRQTLPLVSKVTTNNFKELLSMGTSALIAYINEDDQASRELFTFFAQSHQNGFLFGISSDMKLAKLDASHTPFLVLYNPLDQFNPVFEEDFEVAKIEEFTKRYSTPLMGTFSLETYYAYTEVQPPS
jgi:Thioredoxin-like domain